MIRMPPRRPGRADATPARTGLAAAARATMTRAGAVLACAGALLALQMGSASAASAAAAVPRRTVMILLDIDGSMAGVAPQVRGAALAYVRALPSDVRAGLITFTNKRWLLVLRPTTDRAKLAAAVAASQITKSTSRGIYHALSGATAIVDSLHAAAQSRFLVLSDAEDLTGPVPTATIPTDVVTWRIDGDDRVSNLGALASATGGHMANPAGVAALAAALPPLTSTPEPSRAASTGPAAQPGIAAPGWPWALAGGLAAVFAALFLLVLMVLGSVARTGRERDLGRRIEQYGPRHSPAPAEDEPDGQGKVAHTALGVVARLMSSASQRRLAERLDLAGVPSKPTEWALLGCCAGVVIAAALSLVTNYVLIGVAGGALIGWLTMRLSLSFRIVRRRAAFGQQLPDLLQLVASALQSGFSLPQALDAVIREDAQPAAGELSRALSEARLGGELEDGLEATANRMDSDDLRWTVMAIRIQRGVGGNLAEVLVTIAGTIRERAYLRRQVHALSAEGRLSAYVLIVLPVLVGAWLFTSSPEYMRPLYTTPMGLLMLFTASTLLVVGALWMRKLIKVEI
jgi:Flp pilus assembly protein TadB